MRQRAKTQIADERERRDHLEHWYLQELTPLTDETDSVIPATDASGHEVLVAGWWIAPVIVLSIPAWIAIIYAIIR